MIKRIVIRIIFAGMCLLVVSCGKGSSLAPGLNTTLSPTPDPNPGDTRFAVVELSEVSDFNFGSTTINTPVEMTFTATNIGKATAAQLQFTLAAPFSIKSQTCDSFISGLPPSTSCNITVLFSPTTATLFESVFSLSYDTGNTVTAKALKTLRGAGNLAPASLMVAGTAPTNFQGVLAGSTPPSACITLTNTGGTNLTGLAITQALTSPFGFPTSSVACPNLQCGVSLPPNGSCSIPVTFSPTLRGSYTSPFNLSYFDGAQTKTSNSTIQGNAVQTCTVTNQEFLIFFCNDTQNAAICHHDDGGGRTGGSKVYTLPADANITSFRITELQVDDNSPIIMLNGTQVYSLSEATNVTSHLITPLTIDIKNIIRGGQNTFTASFYNISGPGRATPKLTGSYTTGSACSVN